MRYPAINKQNFSSLRNSLRLLNLFTMDYPELSLSEISDKLEIGLSTAHRLANTLTEQGFLIKDPVTKYYRLAASILAMGNIIISEIDLCHFAKPILERLAKDSGETAHISIFKDTEVVYLLKVDSSYPVHLLSHAGRQNPSYCTSTGQVILAYQKETVIQKVIEKGLQSFTEKTITNPVQLKNVLSTIRKQGFAVSLEEMHEGIASIAAPVKQANGDVFASISIAGPTSRINKQTIPALTKLVKASAEDVSRQLLFYNRKRK